MTSILCGVKINDATSGFRAYTSEAAQSIFITNPYTYTLESLVQLSSQRFKIDHVYVKKNPSYRPSRLFKSTFHYVRKNGAVLLKSYIQFAPMRFFLLIALFSAILGMFGFLPFAWGVIHGQAKGHIQSLLIGTVFMIAAVQMVAIAFIGDAIRASRLSIEKRIKVLISRKATY